ncbi:hypothetical protein [Solimonas soli]|uniref:hypothetical protein n=1 Tax=Solimonas soli TaxID=413479 RepID=UPI0004856D52|nr:hypothetical protein [Solimonas soli]
MPRKPKKQAAPNDASKNYDEFVDEADAIEDDSVAAADGPTGLPAKSRDWRDVEKLQEERRLRKLIADDLDFDL